MRRPRHTRCCRVGAVLLAALMAVPLPMLAHAAPGAEAKEARARVTALLLPEQNLPPALMARLSHAFIKALRRNPRLSVKDSDKLLVEFAGEVPSAQIEEAKEDLKRGVELLDSGDTIFALEQFKKAIASLEPVLSFIKKNTLAEAYLSLGVAQARAGASKAAYGTFVRLLTWRPRYPFDTRKFGAKYLPLYAKAEDAVGRLPKGSVELTTEPIGAKAYVDGRFVGITPTVAYGLAVGHHYATFKKAGFVKAAKRVEVSERKQLKHKVALRRSEKYLLLTQSLKRVREEMGQETASSAMLDLRAFLFIDQVVFARVSYAGEKQVKVRAYLYDLRSKQRLNQVTGTVNNAQLADVRELTDALYAGVRYDGSLEAPPEPPPPPQETRTPIYAKWWFWTAIGVVAAGVALPIILWPDSTSCPDGNRCVTLTN